MRHCLLFLGLFVGLLRGQNPSFQWVAHCPGPDKNLGVSVAVDPLGYVYTTGNIEGTVDFDPGPGVYTLTSAGAYDVFVCKFDASGNFIWAKIIGGAGFEFGASIVVDSQSNTYVAGFFNSPLIDFDPGIGTYTLSAQNGDGYVLKLDSQGNFLWARKFGNTGDDRCTSIALDTAANVHITGWFSSAVMDFDPGPGTYTLASSGQWDVYVSKLDKNGNFIWARKMGGTGSELATSVSVDGSGNVYSAGNLSGSNGDFDPGPGTSLLSTGIYITKLNSSGTFVWAIQVGGPNAQCDAMTTDVGGNVYMTGTFSSLGFFNPNGSITSNGSGDIFVYKCNSSGNFVWAKQLGGALSERGYAIAVDASGNVYTTGGFSGIADFDPGTSTYTLSSANAFDVFISKLDVNGNFVNAMQVGDSPGPSSEIAWGITVDPWNNIYTTGYFSGPVDFDPGSGTCTLTVGNAPVNLDFFLLKLSNCFSSSLTAIPVSSINTCYGSTATLIAISPNLVFWYPSITSSIAIANGSMYVTPTLSPGSYTYFAETTCTLSYNRSPITVNVNSYSTPVITINGNSTTCLGSLITYSASGADTYTWTTGAQSHSLGLTAFTGTTVGVIGTSTSTGCMSGATMNIAVLLPPLVSISGQQTVCSGVNFTLNASGAVSYSWSNGSNSVAVVTLQTSNSVYQVVGTGSNGCQSTVNHSITVSPLPTITVNSGSICSGQSFTFFPSGASTYTFFSNGPPVVSPSLALSPTVTTSFSIMGANNFGCASNFTSAALVLVYPLPTISVNSGSICIGETFSLNPSGALSYSYSSGNQTISPVVTTSYSVIGSSSVGCVAANSAIGTVSVNLLPAISVNSGSICSGEIFTLNPIGALSYTYLAGLSQTVSPGTTTTYSIIGTSSAGCVSFSSALATVSVYPNPIITVNSGTMCAGSIFSMYPAGALNYTYSSGSSTVLPLSNSSYSVTGTSTAGCVSPSFAVANVTVYSLPTITVNSGFICSGSIFTMSPGGALSYTFSSGTSTVSPVSNSTYSISGTNAQGCISVIDALCSVKVHTLPTIAVNSGSMCVGQIFTINPSGASTYTISGGSATISPAVNSTYTITGSNPDGCESASPAVSNVSVYALPIISIDDGTVCAGQSYILNPSGAFSYIFSSGSQTVIPLANTSYTVSGASPNGCLAIPIVAQVTVYPLPTITVNSGSVCQGSSFTLNPSGALTYTFGSGSSTLYPTTTGSYAVTGMDQNGCSSTAASYITVFPLPNLTLTATPANICVGESSTLRAIGANSYLWSNSGMTNSIIVNPLSTTVYSVLGTSQMGCNGKDSTSVLVNECTEIGTLTKEISGISLFPNPNPGNFIVQVATEGEIILLNGVSQVVLKKSLQPGKNYIELFPYSKGIYFGFLKQNQKRIFFKIIVE